MHIHNVPTVYIFLALNILNVRRCFSPVSELYLFAQSLCSRFHMKGLSKFSALFNTTAVLPNPHPSTVLVNFDLNGFI